MTPDRSLNLAINALSQTFGGGITVAVNLALAMARARPQHHFTLYCSMPEVREATLPANVSRIYLPEQRSVLRRSIWEQLRLPGLLADQRTDAVLVLGGFSSFPCRVPQVSVWQNPNILSRDDIPRPFTLKLYIAAQRLAQSLSLRKATRNVFLTAASVELAEQLWPMDRFPHSVIHSGIDPDRVRRPPPEREEGRENIALAVGHTYFHKSYMQLVEAMRVYREQYDDDLRVVVAGGPYEAEHHADIEARIVQLGLQDRVHMLGAQSAEQVSEWYERARLYVVVSRLETFGLTLLESMGSGVPVVASRATCHPEVAGDAAHFCDPEDPADIARRLHEVATDPELRGRLRARGYARVKRFSWDRAGEAYVRELEAAAS